MASLSSSNRSVLLYAAPNSNANMLWFGRFHAGDPLIAFSAKGRKIAAVSLLEVTRAQRESVFDEVLNLQVLLEEVRSAQANAGVAEVVALLAKRNGVRSFVVPPDFPAGLYQQLRELGVRVSIGKVPFFPERVIKTEEEIACLRAGNRASAAGFSAVEKILAASEIADGKVLFEGKVLTAERLRRAVEIACLEAGALNVTGIITAPGDQAVDCHCEGTGPIGANQLIVVDIFPRVSASGYFGDMTRTYLKGKASPNQRKIVRTVREAQKLAFSLIKPGARGCDVHKAILEFFDKAGYATGLNKENGFQEGFFHGLGHGVGLDVHEEPSLSARGVEPLEAGMVVTVEPGLYYIGRGACRIEDVVRVTETGCQLISRHPYRWEFA